MLPKVSVLGDRISIRVWFQVLIASEAYLSTEVWRGAHFPPPLEQPLVGREPEYLKPKKMFQTYGVCGDMQRCGLWWICGFALKMVRGFFWPPAWRCLGLGLRGEQVQVTGAGPQHQGAPHTTVHQAPLCTIQHHAAPCCTREVALVLLLRCPAWSALQLLARARSTKHRQRARTLDPACKQALTV